MDATVIDEGGDRRAKDVDTRDDDLAAKIDRNTALCHANRDLIRDIRFALDGHGHTLKANGETLKSHSAMLKSQSEMLKANGTLLKSRGEKLDAHRVNRLSPRVSGFEGAARSQGWAAGTWPSPAAGSGLLT